MSGPNSFLSFPFSYCYSRIALCLIKFSLEYLYKIYVVSFKLIFYLQRELPTRKAIGAPSFSLLEIQLIKWYLILIRRSHLVLFSNRFPLTHEHVIHLNSISNKIFTQDLIRSLSRPSSGIP